MKAKNKSGSLDEKALQKAARRENVTRIIAIVVAFISVFFFFIKLLFL